MSKELSVLNNLFTGGEIATRSVEDLKAVDAMSNGSSYLKRIQVYSSGTKVNKKMIPGGHLGIPVSAEEIKDMGESIDVFVLERRPKAIDMSDPQNLIIVYDPASAEFKRIEQASGEKDSGCAYGPSYLVFERTTGDFYEYFCGSKSARIESSKINNYLPVSQAMIDAEVTDETAPRGPLPCTIKSTFIEANGFSWFLGKPEDCLTAFDKLPSAEQVNEEIQKFLNPAEPEVETVQDSGRRKR